MAFARLEPFVVSLLDTEYGKEKAQWPDSIKSFFRGMWTGDFDVDMHRVSNALPAQFDSKQSEMIKVLQRPLKSTRGRSMLHDCACS